MRKVKKAVALILVILVCVFILLMLLGAVMQATDKRWEPYVVQPRDTLYDIAADVGVLNPAEFSYEVCKMNDIPYGGLIFPGEVILIYTEVSRWK